MNCSLKNIDFNTSMGYKIKQLINNNINLVSLHTNFDKVNDGTSDTVAKILGLYDAKNLTEEEFSLGKIGSINPMPLEEFLNKVNLTTTTTMMGSLLYLSMFKVNSASLIKSSLGRSYQL